MFFVACPVTGPVTTTKQSRLHIWLEEGSKMLNYHRETALQDALVLAKNGRLELRDNILWAL